MLKSIDPEDGWPSVGSPFVPKVRGAAGESASSTRRDAGPVAWLRRRLGREDARPGFDAEILIPALASIRSSAEILRDTPDIDPAERRRFAEIVLAEEARLEKLVAEMSAAT